MFGLISKKKILEIVKPMAKEYNDSNIDRDTEEKRIREFYYRCGNCNAINHIMSKLGFKFEDYTEIH